MKKILHTLPLIAATLSVPTLAQDYVVTNMTGCYAFGENGWTEDTEDIRRVEGIDVDVRPILIGGTVSKSVTRILNGETQVVDGAVFVDYQGNPELGTYPETLVHSCINPAGFYDNYDWNGQDAGGRPVSEYHCPGYDSVGHSTEYLYGTKMQTNQGPVLAIQTEARSNIVPDPNGGADWKFANPTLVLIYADSQLGRACQNLIDSGVAPEPNPEQPTPEVTPEPQPQPEPQPEPDEQPNVPDNSQEGDTNAPDQVESGPQVDLGSGSLSLGVSALLAGLTLTRKRPNQH